MAKKASLKIWVRYDPAPAFGQDSRDCSPVKLRIPIDGSPVSYHRCQDHEEGYHCVAVRFTLDVNEGILILETHTSSSDCDGPMTTSSEHHSPVTLNEYDAPMMARIRLDDDDIRIQYPTWKPASYRQRDYFAESMGY